jgi:tRNA threonylcarbamoyladenosine modification (KEOPS) complex Cgi121 subunit
MKKEEKNSRSDEQICFCYGLKFNNPINITEIENEVENKTNATIQAVNKKFILNREHALSVLSQSYEAYKRGIYIARKPKLDIILRLLCTHKIEQALRDSGVKNDDEDCVVLGFCDKAVQQVLIKCLSKYGIFDEHLIEASEQKEKFLIEYHKITLEEQANYSLVQLLNERPATNLVRYYRSKVRERDP